MIKSVRLCMAAIMAVSTLTGCSSTMTVRDVGIGMQLGSLGGNGGILAPIVWGTGFVLEQVGDAVGSGGHVAADKAEPEILELGETTQPESQLVD